MYIFKNGKSMSRKTVQSPICLTLGMAQIVDDAVPLRYIGHWHQRGKALLTNNGQTAVLTLSHRPFQPCIVGGPLSGVYLFEQLHFHWGPDDNYGCEHLLDGTAYAMEIHLVHYNAKYSSFGEAMNKADGLAVVAFLVHARGTVDCKDFQQITCQLQRIELPNSKAPVATDCMDWLTMRDLSRHYYFYDGTMTTAPYSSSVSWIVYQTPIYVSHGQTAAFRQLRTFAEQRNKIPGAVTPWKNIESNFRPVQTASTEVAFVRNITRPMRAKL